MRRHLLAVLLILAWATTATAATEGTPAPLAEALARSRAAIGRPIPDLTLMDADGRPFRLAALRGRPYLLTFIYTACSSVCPTLVQNLAPIIEDARANLGRDRFAVVAVGFDVQRDDPAAMRAFARRQGIDPRAWHFLSGDAVTVKALAEAVGFTFVPSAGGFQHLAQVTLVDASGRIVRQIHGDAFTPPQIIEPLKDVVLGRDRPVENLGDVIDRIRLWCTVYDPASGRYYFDYSFFIGLAIGMASLSLVGTVLWREWARSGGRSRPTPGGIR